MATVLTIDPGGARFAINGEPVFLLGASYYGGLGASDAFVDADLADLRRYGVNWIRVWCTWGAFGRDVSAVDRAGEASEPGMSRLAALCERADAMGMVVDVTFSRGNGVVNPPFRRLGPHRTAVAAVAERLRPYRNVYIDMGNERNLLDRRLVRFEELDELRDTIRRIDPDRLATASASGDIPLVDVSRYLLLAKVDFLAPHRPRCADAPAQTAARTVEALDEARRVLCRPVPVHYQEPFRRDWRTWQPTADDFVADLRAAIEGGAAGWCFHNGDNQARADGRPRRSFDMSDDEGRLFDQLDDEERTFLDRVGEVIGGR